MKRFLFSMIITLITYAAASAQTDHGYNLYGQFLGSSTGAGVGFDSSFKPGGVFGYSAGIAFTDIEWSDDLCAKDIDGIYGYTEVHSTGVAIPLEINAIMGSRASKFEISVGATAYLLRRNEHHHEGGFNWDAENEEDFFISDDNYRKVVRPNIAATLGIAYRLQRKNGFFMKLGLNLILGDLKCSPIDSYIPLPNICLGYTIPHF